MLWLKIDFHSGIPVYRQITEAIKSDVISGRLPAGEAIPSIRELARDLNINPNTVARAYRELESAGLIYTRPGIGTFIYEKDQAQMEAQALETMREELRRVLRLGHLYNLDHQTILELFYQILQEQGG